MNKSVVYVGSKTGRDGIHGASMASAEFDENSEEKTNCASWRSIYRKLLLEACLELMKDDSIIAIQDMERGVNIFQCRDGKGSLGIELELDKVPCRR